MMVLSSIEMPSMHGSMESMERMFWCCGMWLESFIWRKATSEAQKFIAFFDNAGKIEEMIMELTQYKPLALAGFCGQEGFFLCYALLSLGCRGRFKMVC
jgi:hypothetical protein